MSFENIIKKMNKDVAPFLYNYYSLANDQLFVYVLIVAGTQPLQAILHLVKLGKMCLCVCVVFVHTKKDSYETEDPQGTTFLAQFPDVRESGVPPRCLYSYTPPRCLLLLLLLVACCWYLLVYTSCPVLVNVR